MPDKVMETIDIPAFTKYLADKNIGISLKTFNAIIEALEVSIKK